MSAPVVIAHRGMPCDPPIIDGVEFRPLGEDDVWVAECSEELAADLTRIPAFTRYGGGTPVPPAGSTDNVPTLAEKLAAMKNKGEVVTFAKEAYGLELDPASKREELEAAVVAEAEARSKSGQE